MNQTPGFEVVPTDGASPREHVVAGFASPDLAALTAVDYLIDTHEATSVAAIRTRGLPDVAPITDGQPRHPIRGYTIDALDVTVLVAEVFVPVSLADQFATALGEWLESGDVSSFTLLHGGQFPHSEEQHVPFLAGTDRYRERFGEEAIASLPSGMLDGIAGEALLRGLDDTFPPSGVIVTPAHLPGPDFSGALALLSGLSTLHGLAIDDAALRERSEQLREYYEGLVDRMQTLQEADATAANRDFPEDRMYM